MSPLPSHKTRIVCTIGPASRTPAILERLLRAGMDVARLNLAHGDFASHQATIAAIRAASAHTGRRVAVMADLPGPKLRVGSLATTTLDLKRGQSVRLVATGGDNTTAAGAETSPGRPDIPDIPLTLAGLPPTLRRGKDIFLDDGLIQLRLRESAQNHEAMARVIVGGTLRSRDGVSLPGIDLGISAFTNRDHKLLAFAASEAIDAVAVSFVQEPEDIMAVRKAAAALDFDPFIVAKIERAQAVENIDAILKVADGLMVARGDLGVEIPIERVAVAQKLLIGRANQAGRPVITATQMLESMTENRRPTRAEVTDVANAVLDGTDCVMLSEETAMGAFPVDAVSVMARVTATTERHLPGTSRPAADASTVRGVLAQGAAATAERLGVRYILVPTETGTTARAIARLRPRAWIVAFSPFAETCQQLQFSRGVHPVFVPEAAHQRLAPTRAPDIGRPSADTGAAPEPLLTCEEVDWHGIARRWLATQRLTPGLAVMIQGNNRLEVIDLASGATTS
jgi:pyruvate kinase